MIDTKTENLMPPIRSPQGLGSSGRKMFTPIRALILAVLIVLLAVVFLTNKGLLVAAFVDGKPIFRWELNNVLVSRFGKQTLEGIISERLIADEARKSSIDVMQEEIDAKINEIVKNLGGNVKIEDLLTYQGMTKADFKSQIRLQLAVEKLLGKNFTVSDSEIANYIATNAATLSATNPAQLREQAREAIFNQYVSSKLQSWFIELKNKAKIVRFL